MEKIHKTVSISIPIATEIEKMARTFGCSFSEAYERNFSYGANIKMLVCELNALTQKFNTAGYELEATVKKIDI